MSSIKPKAAGKLTSTSKHLGDRESMSNAAATAKRRASMTATCGSSNNTKANAMEQLKVFRNEVAGAWGKKMAAGEQENSMYKNDEAGGKASKASNEPPSPSENQTRASPLPFRKGLSRSGKSGCGSSSSSF